MNKQTEVLKMAIEALQNIDNWLPTIGQRGLRDYEADALQACKEALELSEKQHTISDKDQPAQEYLTRAQQVIRANNSAQEPVAWLRLWVDGDLEVVPNTLEGAFPVYTHPAPSWQRLSDDELHQIVDKLNVSLILHCDISDFVNAIEIALKEKNGR